MLGSLLFRGYFICSRFEPPNRLDLVLIRTFKSALKGLFISVSAEANNSPIHNESILAVSMYG